MIKNDPANYMTVGKQQMANREQYLIERERARGEAKELEAKSVGVGECKITDCTTAMRGTEQWVDYDVEISIEYPTDYQTGIKIIKTRIGFPAMGDWTALRILARATAQFIGQQMADQENADMRRRSAELVAKLREDLKARDHVEGAAGA